MPGVWVEDPRLDGLPDVDLTTSPPTGGQTLIYNETTNVWEPGSIVTEAAVRSVVHGDDPNVERPATDEVVLWVGTVAPLEAMPWDVRVVPGGSTTDPVPHREVVLSDFGTGLEPATATDGDWLYGRYPGSLEYDA